MKHLYSFIYVTALSLVIGSLTAEADVLGPAEALARVNKTKPAAARVAAKISDRLPVMTAKTAAGEPAVYVFDTPASGEGYLIVSAESEAPALLGYSDRGSVRAETMPPSMRYWLETYTRQIEAARQSGVMRATARPARDAIAPLCKTHWNQDAPYNDLCPMDNGKRSVTGCVATALAQVMAYHQWPEKGTGSKSYSWNGQTLTVNYGETTYDWANMLDTYTSTATEAQRNAVATLMYSCGVSVSMDYSSSESGASSLEVVKALADYFGYDKGVRYLSRDNYGLVDWENIVYSQLTDYGPVQYSGQSSEGGHSFVCDGYSSDGYFHFNWGWGGLSDGYYLLTALDPMSQGIGGSTSGFNFDQDIIACVKRPSGTSEYYYNLMLTSDFLPASQTAVKGNSIQFNGDIFNFTPATFQGALGLKVVAVPGGETRYLKGTEVNLSFGAGRGAFFVAIPDDVSDGTYTVSPAYCDAAGKWTELTAPITSVSSLTMTVSGQSVTFEPIVKASVNVSDIATPTPFYLGSEFHITATAANTSATYEYYGPVCAAFIDSNNEIAALGNEYQLDIEAGGTNDVDYYSNYRFSSQTGEPDPGDYTLYFVNAKTYEPVSDGIPVTLLAAPDETSITVTDVHMTDGNTTAVDRTDVSVSATLTCSAGYFTGKLTLAIFPYTSGSVAAVAQFSTPIYFISAGNSQDVVASGNFVAAEPGKEYMAAFFSGSRQISDPVRFKIATPSAIYDIENNTGIIISRSGDLMTVTGAGERPTVRIHDISGSLVIDVAAAEVDCSALASGLCIVTVTAADGSVLTTKIVK